MNKLSLGLLVGAVSIAAIASAMSGAKSGLTPGESVTPYHPSHVVGPLAGKDSCFPCTYQNAPQVQVFVNGDNMDNVVKIAKKLEGAVEANKSKGLRAMIVMIANKSTWDAQKTAIKNMAAANKLNDLHISLLDPKDEAISAYKINTAKDVKNTVLFYKNWKVSKSQVNLTADSAGVKAMEASLASILG